MDKELDREQDTREPDLGSIIDDEDLLGDDLGVDLGEDDDAPVEDSFDDEDEY